MEEQENIHNIKRNMSDHNILGPVLVSVEKSDQSSYIHVDKDEFKIGRGRANDEIIAHVSISRQHCIFKRKSDDNKWTIQDVSSSGTLVNGNQLLPGEIKNIEIGDMIQLGPLNEFLYKFDLSKKNEPVAKRARMTAPDMDHMNQIVMKKKTFEESQQMERDNLAEQMKAKHIEQMELKNELEKLLNDRDAALGEKDDLNKQINVLEKNIEDVKVAEMNLEKLNKELSERLDKERQEFEMKLNEEKKKVEEALEMSRKEKEILENNMKKELEKLKNEQEIQCKKLTESLDEEKKTAEKLQTEKTEFAQKIKEMEDALCKIEAKANELQNTLEQQNASKAPQVVALGTVAENVEIVDESNLTILDTIDLTVDAPPGINKAAESTSSGETANEQVFNKVGDIMDEQLTCSICSELFVTAMTLNCTHTFCQYCINTWMKKKKECPVCRTGITAMNRSLVLDNFIDKMVENLSTEYKERRTEIVDERRENERLANEPNNQAAGGRRGRGRRGGANANQNQNRPGNAASSGTNTTGNNPGRTERTDGIQHRRSEARNNQDWNNASSSSDQLEQQQPATTGSTSNYQQTSATGQGSSTAYEQTNDEDDSSNWSSSTDGDTASTISSESNSQSSEDTEGHVSDVNNVTDRDQDTDDHSTYDSWAGMDYGYDDEFWSDPGLSDDEYVEGVRGATYGGYGSCYNCGKRGHWSPGCPYR